MVQPKTFLIAVLQVIVNRRQCLVLSISALSAPLAGCTDGSSADAEEAETSPGSADSSCWPSMCEGTQLIEVDVDSAFSGTVILEASCRDEAVSIQSGESVRIIREEDGADCGVTLSIDDEQVYNEYIEDHVSVSVTVTSNGEVDDETVMV